MINTLSLEELNTKLKSLGPKELILDVRRPDEFAEGHVPGSKNISHELVGERLKELQGYDMVYIYCRSGGRVQKAAMELLGLGFKNFKLVVDGGFPDWQSMGFPVEK